MNPMKPKVMKPLRWPVNKDQSDYMAMRKRQNVAKSKNNLNENWMAEKLKETGEKWSRNARWGYRLFDFWCHRLGVAVEVDGPEHDREYDAYRDEYNFRRSGILVIRVRNRNEDDAKAALLAIREASDWRQRRADLGLNAKTKKGRRHLVNGGALL